MNLLFRAFGIEMAISSLRLNWPITALGSMPPSSRNVLRLSLVFPLSYESASAVVSRGLFLFDFKT